MNFLQAFILGIVEGVTEFLPVSSTGHLILASQLLGVPDSDFLKSFEISIQLGAILSVVALYFRRFFDLKIISRLIVAFLPTGVLGVIAYPFIKGYLLGSEAVVLTSLLLGGIGLIIFEKLHHEPEDAVEDMAQMPYRTAVSIGLFQAIAMVPGVSRSAATILGGLFLGLKRRTIAEFSFLLAVPTMAAATGLDLLDSAWMFSDGQIAALGVGFATSFFVAMASIVFLMRYIQRHTFTIFGYYRILAAVLLAMVLFSIR